MTGPTERAARALATRHYASQLGLAETHQYVQADVDANWRDFMGEVDAVLEALREPSASMAVQGGTKIFLRKRDATRIAGEVWREMVNVAITEGLAHAA